MTMHTKRLLLGATGLLFAGSLLAHNTTTGSTPHQAHKEILFVTVTSTYNFQDGTKASWSIDKSGNYQVVLEQDTALNDPAANDNGATSLLTVGVQGIDNHTRFTLLAGTGVEVIDYSKPNPTWTRVNVGDTVMLKKTGTKAHGGGADRVDEDKVSFIRYSGKECKLQVESDRVRKGQTKWYRGTSPLSSHDNTPPGTPPSAEN